MKILASQAKFNQANELQNEKFDRLLSKQGDLITAVNNLSAEIKELKQLDFRMRQKNSRIRTIIRRAKEELLAQMLLIEVKKKLELDYTRLNY
ncbi:hypothetical protein QYM36_016731 [Artemia franciscana]|uniref:Uncharacterized protein n=1 Tax=Artemia franciscana TaxID=6661 RepID=A0AA88HFG1_ARTSF|nr:hypothetical protein QYM36_016731 [Artemia franciscana]